MSEVKKNGLRFRGIMMPNSNHPAIRKAKKEASQPSIHGTKLWKSSALVIDYLDKNPPPFFNRVLDVGCGWGIGGIWCAKKLTSQVTSMDADPDVFRFLNITASINKVETTPLILKFAQLRKKDLEAFDLLIAADICFWDELVDPVYRMIERAINAGVKQIVISDPERPTFMKMAERCLEKHGGDLLEMETKGSVNARGSVLVIKNY